MSVKRTQVMKMKMRWASTYNVNAFVPGDTNLCALSTKIYANDTHGCGKRGLSRQAIESGKRLDSTRLNGKERGCARSRGGQYRKMRESNLFGTDCNKKADTGIYWGRDSSRSELENPMPVDQKKCALPHSPTAR